LYIFTGVKRSWLSFTDDDLAFLITTLMPETTDHQRMIRVLREDEEILEGMLADEKVLHRLLDAPSFTLLRVSPDFFFSVLLARVRIDLARQPWTLERTSRLSMVLFDSPQVVELLSNREIRHYLAALLVSFVRVNSFSATVRVRNGVWRRVRFSDFDIDSLLRYGNALDESQRFPAYKRIADICLFTLGIFSPSPGPQDAPLALFNARLRMAIRRSREDYIEQGGTFYRLAARHRDASAEQLAEVLALLSEKIALAAKPLTVMSAKYLAPFKDQVFLQ
jgi:hypothetical protein